jgi:hypothetical protein
VYVSLDCDVGKKQLKGQDQLVEVVEIFSVYESRKLVYALNSGAVKAAFSSRYVGLMVSVFARFYMIVIQRPSAGERD